MGLTTHRGKAVFVHVLTLACFVVQFFVGGQLGNLIGLGLAVGAGVVAFSNRFDAMPWSTTHHEHVLRTLIIAFVITTLVGLPTLVIPTDTLSSIYGVYGPILFWTNLIVLIWVVIRSGVGLVLAILRKPIPHPRGWLL
jgi:uncharacterized membrane protein